MTEAIDQLITLFAANWNTGNYDPRGYSQLSDFFKKIIDAPKMPQVRNNDYFFLYDILETHDFSTLSQKNDDVKGNIAIDLRTNTSDRLTSIKNEAIRILRENIVNVGGGWDRLTFSDFTNRSDKNRGFYWMVFQVTLYDNVLTS